MTAQSTFSRPLWQLAVGESSQITAIEANTLGNAAQRLIDIGFREGQRVTCLMRLGFGAPHVYAVGGATYSLDQRTANVVFVSPESSA